MENEGSLPSHLSLAELDNNTTKPGQDIPGYFQAGHEVRRILTQKRLARELPGSRVDLGLFPMDCQTEAECIAKVHSLHSIEDCFKSIDQLVQTNWNESVFNPTNPDLPMNGLISEWKKTLTENDAEKYSQLIMDLSNLDSIDQQFSLRQFGFLEGLREAMPEAWLSLLSISSERQLAKLVVANEWFKYLSNDQIKEFGFSNRSELDYLLLLQSLSGKYVDQAYIKQVKLSDGDDAVAGVTSDSDLQQFVYKLPGDKILAYADVFRFDYRRVGKNFENLSQKVSTWVENGTLPESYRGHIDYLNLLSKLYGDTLDTDDTVNDVGNRWMGAFSQLSKIIDAGCPIVPIFQSTPSVAGERQVDNELRIGIVSPMSKIISELGRVFTDNAMKISKDLKSDHPSVRSPIDVFTISTFGPNMYWEVRGEADPGITFLHHNSIEEVASTAELPLVRRLIDQKVDPQKYVAAAVTETCRHEVAHKVLSPEDDPEIRKALATSDKSDILEEIKAETVGIKLASPEELDHDNLAVTVEGKLGTLLDYLAHKEDKNYLVPAAVIFSQLFDDQLISFDETSQRLLIGDYGAVIDSISEIGNTVLDLYQEVLGGNDKQSLIDNFVQQSAGKLTDPNVLKLIALCKNSS